VRPTGDSLAAGDGVTFAKSYESNKTLVNNI